jgi:hypothetical protein
MRTTESVKAAYKAGQNSARMGWYVLEDDGHIAEQVGVEHVGDYRRGGDDYDAITRLMNHA